MAQKISSTTDKSHAMEDESKASLPWVEKYRPSNLNDLISHKEIVKTIMNFMSAGQLPHLLLYGPPGTGKTSTITACAHQFYDNPSQYRSMVLELNASDDRGINVVREKIMNFCSTGLFYRSKDDGGQKHFSHKLVILDEADAMTADAQNALRRIIEQFTANVRFCFICNYLSPIIPAIQSRCTRFRFAPLTKDQMVGRLEHVAKCENVKVEDPSALEALYSLSKGDMRRALSMMQSTHLSRGLITVENVYECAARPSPEEIRNILFSLLNEPIKQSFQAVEKMRKENGYALNDLITETSELVIKLSIPAKIKIEVVRKLAEVEWRIAGGACETLQAGSFVAAFQPVRSVDPSQI